MKKRMRITVNNQTYDVEAEILDDHHVPSPVASAPVGLATPVMPPKTAPKKVIRTEGECGLISSPIAGMVVSIAQTAGKKVAAGDVLLVLEAMKMNTEVTAPFPGTVTAVHVSQGESVEEGQELITIA
ncbi:MAG: acetyl-CoA carboxylase biotin carboxyl carrier protein subunit [Desulfobulbus propionicus]|nr:MAG: acetyl-CoA carboxylase biotin carboxyl carrier protein subunit [Desulfobulbus propionicus]